MFSVAGKQYAQSTLGGEPPFRNGVIGALPLPFGSLPTAQCIEGIRRSAVIGLCRPLWRPLASAEEGADSLSAGQSVSAGGVTRAKRAVSEVWVGTPVPVDYPCIDGRPLFQQLPRQPSQRSRPVPRAKEKSLSEFFHNANGPLYDLEKNTSKYRIKSLFSALSHAKTVSNGHSDYAVGFPASECARAASSLTKALMQVSSSGS